MNPETYSNVEELLLKECRKNEELRKIIFEQAQEISRLSQKLAAQNPYPYEVFWS